MAEQPIRRAKPTWEQPATVLDIWIAAPSGALGVGASAAKSAVGPAVLQLKTLE